MTLPMVGRGYKLILSSSPHSPGSSHSRSPPSCLPLTCNIQTRQARCRPQTVTDHAPPCHAPPQGQEAGDKGQVAGGKGKGVGGRGQGGRGQGAGGRGQGTEVRHTLHHYLLTSGSYVYLSTQETFNSKKDSLYSLNISAENEATEYMCRLVSLFVCFSSSRQVVEWLFLY